jgi:DNA-binding transcriptional LysR family regulator
LERRQLECFVGIVDSGGFREAAGRLFLTQSAVSQALKALESELGESLVNRPPGGRGGRLSLTAAGELFLPIARDILRRFDEGRQAVEQLRGLLSGRLALGAVDVAAMYHLPDPLRAFKRTHPGLEISVRVAGSRALVSGLQGGELDLVFVLGTAIPAGLAGRSFREDPMDVVAPTELLRTLGRDPRPETVADLGWITYPRGSVTRAILEAAFREAGLPFPVRMEIDRPEAIFQLVRAGLGLAVLPQRLLDAQRWGRDLRRIALAGLAPIRPIQILHRPEASLSPAARIFLAELD